MNLTIPNRVLVALFIAILVISICNTILILQNNDTIMEQRSQDLHNQDKNNQSLNQLLDQANQAINQTNHALKQTNYELKKNIEALNQTNVALDQAFTELNQTDHMTQDLLNRKIDNLDARLPLEEYDYIIYRNRGDQNNSLVYSAKNGRTGRVDFDSDNAAIVFNQALANANSIYIKSDEYVIYSNILMANKKNARLDSDGATLNLNGNKIIISGTSYELSQNNHISGLIVVNGTLRIENSFRTTITNMIFESCTVGLELANTNTWTECTRIDTIHFTKCTQSLVFRTNTTSIQPESNSTGSYSNTEINRCYFNQLDNSIAITVEEQAEFTDSHVTNVRIWIAEHGNYNQTGIQLEGSMYKTVMSGIVFESFAAIPLEDSLLYAMKIGSTAYEPPILGSGVNILGGWTARIFNPEGAWIYGVGAVFKQTGIVVPVGSNTFGATQVFHLHPATIVSFTPKFTVQGSFLRNETITVRLRIEFVDNVVSSPVEKEFTCSGSCWLGDEDFLQLFGYVDVIHAVLFDAKVTSLFSDASVNVDIYGITT